MKGLKNGMSSVSRRNITQRLVVFASHLPSSSSSSSDSTSMASEKQAALATAPSDADAPTIFDKIINKEIPSNVVYEDDKVFAFRDINPQAPTHILIIPKVKDGLTGLSKAEERHFEILGCLLYTAKLIAKQEGLDDGFRVVINDGPKGYYGWPEWLVVRYRTSKVSVRDLVISVGRLPHHIHVDDGAKPPYQAGYPKLN
ncbi:hypothetical protein AHAS_Ahas08G0002700 [Arachis hypogaea]